MRGGPGAALDDSTRDMKGALKRLVRMLKPERYRVAGVIVLMLIGTLASVLTPKYLGDATNVIVDGISADTGVDFTALRNVLLFVVALYVTNALGNFFGGVLARISVQNLAYRLRRQSQEKVDRLALSYLDKQSRGDLLSRLTNDIDNIAQTLMQTLNHTIQAIYTVIGILSIMLWLSWSLTLWSFVVLPLGMFAMMKILQRSKPQFRKQWQKTGEVSSIVEESFTGSEVVAAYGLEDQFDEVFTEANDELFDAGFKGQFFSQLSHPIMGFVGNMSFVVVAVVGGLQVINGQLTIGGIQAFIQYSRQINQPVSTIASMMNMLQSGAASGERIFDFLDTPEMEEDAETAYDDVVPAHQRRGNIAFAGVSFGYDPGNPVIKDLSLSVHRGQQVAIVGPTGAGKTTLVNLLERFYEIDGGAIAIDGADIRDFSKSSLRSMIGMVLQDTWLFEGTIEENIAYGKEGATFDEVVAAAQAIGVDRLIRQLPDGYQTMIGDQGDNISAGERQLLTIARAYLSDPNILILDEATSSVDTRTEMLVQRAMSELREGRTSFVIAHRLSTIRDADLIIVMVDGDVVEQGTHDSLLARGGFYHDLYQSQFAGPQG
ncbi:MAG: ABC transporter ATP-binding protein [Actinomycetaceae bacterium]|nr:ABC transporter ATP-binding protein [Actinomycetaceae bacterium]